MHFSLEDEAWQAFMDSLDRPAEFKPKLAELLSEPDPFVD